jgi:hypothetical protein
VSVDEAFTLSVRGDDATNAKGRRGSRKAVDGKIQKLHELHTTVPPTPATSRVQHCEAKIIRLYVGGKMDPQRMINCYLLT